MPYSPEHKRDTREKIVESARRLFNRKGFSEVSIDEVMENACLTRGIAILRIRRSSMPRLFAGSFAPRHPSLGNPNHPIERWRASHEVSASLMPISPETTLTTVRGAAR